MSKEAALIGALKSAGLHVMSAAYGNGGISAHINGECDAWDRFRLSQGYTAEQAEAADKLADVVGSVTFLGNGPDGATIAVGDLTRLAVALDEYRNAKRDGGPHA